jgi:uncharacterized membrane protein (DUF4010 family)
MVNLSDFEPWWRFGVALAIGALLGLEREFVQQQEGAPDFAGIRTFSLIALLGAVVAFVAPDLGPLPLALSLGGLVLLTTVSYRGALQRSQREKGITTEVAAFLTFLFGALVVDDKETVAIALGVVTALLLASKGRLHGLVRRMTSEDIHLTLQFALVAAVILPLLPDRAIDPWGLLNPAQIWLMVVFVSGIGFTGYVLMKALGPTRGINLMGVLGGVASSTATTASFSAASRREPSLSSLYARAVVLASTVMMPRVLLLVLVASPSLLPMVSPPFAAMFITGLIIVVVLQRRSSVMRGGLESPLDVGHPLRLSTAVKFGLVFAVVLVVVELARGHLGPAGVFLTSVLAGTTDVDAITLSVSRLAGGGQLSPKVAGISMAVAALVNTVSKGAIAYFTGSRELRRVVVRAFGAVLVVGIASSFIIFWLV